MFSNLTAVATGSVILQRKTVLANNDAASIEIESSSRLVQRLLRHYATSYIENRAHAVFLAL
jgi:hypothetical protein